MRRATWLACGLLGASTLTFGACGGDDDDSGGSSTATTTDTTSSTSSGGSGTTTNNTSTNNTTSGTSTTSVGGTTGSGGTGGGAGMAGMGGEGGAAPERPDCEDIPSRAFGDEFTVSSDDFSFCGAMADENTCEGKLFPTSVSPEVNWTEGPEGTMSYAITFTDITILAVRDPEDPTYNQGYHYVIWDIPADVLTLPAELDDGHLPDGIEGARQWAPFQNYAFMGPCPNMPPPEDGDPPPLNNDAYSFTVYALPVETLDVPQMMEGWSFPRLMDEYLKDNALAAAEYRGTSDAQASTTEDDGVSVFPPVFDIPCPSEGDQPENCLEGP